MGHYLSETDEFGVRATNNYWDRVHALRKKLSDIPLSKLNVTHLPVIMKLFGFVTNGTGSTEKVNELEFKLLEIIVKNRTGKK
jgi:hypothetical protein